MSSGAKTALAVALGAGGGFLLWYLLRDEELTASTANTNPSALPPVSDPDAPCALRLDATGLSADGEKTDVVGAVARCKTAKAARLVLASDAPAAVYVELSQALARAGIPVSLWGG